ncbi:tRNA (N(6)-L-threonylcarbamoyladenosine(37)-C(2))-methylthiotransferase MtaB [Treponema sp. HNW]|uniref:tRNA (N(6)-L-threonylcarbamoyladenosine(37)-C(2))- methylthiotransferase MtaB n=1 Tax=Treponema sp. HNW TaxID=3116654 RepID=UPI003D0CB3ED
MKQNPTVRFETLGCKLNQIESESAARAFSEGGFDCRMGTVTSASSSDAHTLLCIVNTCTVTAKAEQKCRRLIRLLLQKYPCAAILVTGCYAQLDSLLLSAIDKRIAVLGGRRKDALVQLPAFLRAYTQRSGGHGLCAGELLAAELRSLYDEASGFKPDLQPQELKKAAFVLSTDTFLQHSRPSLKIQDGCDNRCSYCRICFARGPSVSLQADTVLERVLQLEKAGHPEVVLTGVNLGQYRFERGGLSALLAYLLEHTARIAFRLSSLHPQIVDDALCRVLSDGRIRPHFHLSVQSGSDKVLTAMRRPYKADCVRQAVERLRSVKPFAFIACDIIAGFPGESREDFEHTLDLCRSCNFSWIHAFPFSPRPGTAACTMKESVSPREAHKRVYELTLIAEAQKKAYIEGCIGKRFKAVIEKFRKGEVRAVTENFLHVRVQRASESPLGLKTRDNTPEHLGGSEVTLYIKAVNETGFQGEDCEAFAALDEHSAH